MEPMLWSVVAVAFAQAPEPYPEQVACDQGIGAACTALGKAWLRGEGVPIDTFQAASLFRRGCDLEHAHACMFLAEAYRTGEGMLPDQARALELYRRACDLGDGVGCRSVGDLLTMGTTGEVDGRTAGTFYALGCDLGDAQSCTAAGLWTERGEGGVPGQSLALFERACAGGHLRGCTLLGDRYARGSDGATRDRVKAYAYYRQGCRPPFDPEACRELGHAQVKGKLVPRDRESGIRNLDRACYANEPVACRYLAQAQLDGDEAEALMAAERGCDLGDLGACRVAERVRFRLMTSDAP